jgi:DNA-binding IclR family transcriptional regulator
MHNDVTGAQSVERAISLLRAVAEEGEGGAAAAALASRLALHRTTAHRLLKALAAEGLLERGEDGRFYLGAELVGLGLIASGRHGVLRHAADALGRLAAETGDTAFLSALSGFDSLCLKRQEGDFPIRTQVLWPGQRHPLGVGAGSLAMLSALPDERVAEIVEANAPRVAAAFPKYRPVALWDLVHRTRAEGFATNEGMIVSGSWAVGVAVRAADDAPIAAFSLSAIEPRMSPDRRRELARLLHAQAARVAQRLSQPSSHSR